MESNSVIFEDQDNIVKNVAFVSGSPSGITAWVIKSKLAANAKQAQELLLGLVIVCVVLAIGLFVLYGTLHTQKITPQQIQRMMNEHN